MAWSPLGLETSAGDFRGGVKIVDEGQIETIKQSYDLPFGKVSHVDVHARQLTFQVANEAGNKLDVRFYVSDNGVAFTYRIPGPDGEVEVLSEATSFAFPEGTRSYLHPMAVAKSGWARTQPSYEEYYVEQPAGGPSPLKQGWCLPALFQVADRGWVLIGETGVDPGYFGSRLAEDSAERRLPD